MTPAMTPRMRRPRPSEFLFNPAPDKYYAFQVMTDGTEKHADDYVRGDDGFVRARWADMEEEVQLEVANSQLVEGRLVPTAPPQLPKRILSRKKPAAAKKRLEKTDPQSNTADTPSSDA